MAVVLLAVAGSSLHFARESAPVVSAADGQPTLSIGSDAPAAPLVLRDSFVLPLGTRSGIAVGAQRFNSLETVFSNGRATYVVDHPGTPPGARVRWFVHGKLAGTHQAPPGSLFFAADGDGFSYIVSKYRNSSEQAVLVDARGKVRAKYVIPRELNAGGLRHADGTLWAITWSGTVDPATAQVAGRDMLVPVAIDGRQVSDADALRLQRDGWAVSANGQAWSFGVKGRQEALRGYLAQGAREVGIPLDAALLGVDAFGRAWVALQPQKAPGRAVAGWPANDDATALLVAFDATGRVAGATPVRAQLGAALPSIELARRVGFDGAHLALADEVAEGIRISVYEVTR